MLDFTLQNMRKYPQLNIASRGAPTPTGPYGELLKGDSAAMSSVTFRAPRVDVLEWAWERQVSIKEKLVLLAACQFIDGFHKSVVLRSEEFGAMSEITGLPESKVFNCLWSMATAKHFDAEKVAGRGICITARPQPIPHPEFLASAHRNPGYVYLLENEGFYKIGRARNVEGRTRALRTGSPHETRCIASRSVGDAVAYERHLHELFMDKRTVGEWFALNANDVRVLTKALAEADD